ncbi:unnamed protein product [Calicophoron daubneyi]|uniref:RRM domain-containing protein n=1 Tax=Calicophoron daubneyi TaxID=300641 RepID=A0AAV2TGB4_CALDB
MSATFEKRLRTKPVKSRLGNFVSRKSDGGVDLREKLNSTLHSLDARSILRNRRRTRASRDARNILRRKGRLPVRPNPVPFMIPIRTIPNDRYNSTRINRIRTNAGILNNFYAWNRSRRIPDLLSLPTVLPNSENLLQRAVVPGGLFSDLASPNLITCIPSSGTTVSPIQGYRVEVRNLQSSVTLDDVFELFSSIGALRLCKLIRPGQAEVIFNEPSDAKEAVRRYNGRELDNRPMQVTLVTPVDGTTSDASGSARFGARLGPSVGRVPNTGKNVMPPTPKQLNLASVSAAPIEIDMDVVRKALFNVSTPGAVGPRRPVDFNVSLR